MKTKKPTLQKVAATANVSIATVSRVLNGGAGVSPFVLKNVLSVMEKLGYDRSSRSSQRDRLVGLIIPNVLNSFFPLLIKGVEAVAKIRGCSIILCDSEDSSDIEAKNIERLVKLDVDGIILIPSGDTNPRLKSLIDEKFPIVFADRTIKEKGSWSVTSDNEEGAYQAVKYLINLGHKRIVHLIGSSEISTARDRFEGYKKALTEASLEIAQDLIINGGYHYESAHEAIGSSIDAGLQFSAIFAGNDLMALGAMLAVKEKQDRVPGEISILGYDDIPFSALIGLTTIAQPAYEMGRNSMLLLLDVLEGRMTDPQHLVLRPSMVIRETCKQLDGHKNLQSFL